MDEDEEKKAIRIRLTLDSRLDEVFLVGLSVRSICAYLFPSETEASQLEICVVEVVNNAIKHSYRLEPGHDVDINIAIYSERIEFKVSNTGEPMPSTKALNLDFDPKDVRALPEGGMGLHIIRSIMDEVSYQCLEGINTVTMCKRLSKKGNLSI